MKKTKQKKLNNKIHVIPSERSKQFIENFNKNKPTEEFIESCKKARELFGGETNVSSGETISKDEVLALINKAMDTTDNKDIQDYIFCGLRRDVNNLPSADRPTLKQTDTLIIADALRYLAKDTERHELDRTRAEELREQILKYGASMCHSADRPKGEWIDKGEYAECSICGAHSGKQFDGVEPIPLKTPYCPSCGADMRGEK